MEAKEEQIKKEVSLGFGMSILQFGLKQQ